MSMRKSLNAVFCLCFLLISISFAQNQPAKQNESENSTKKEITEIKLPDEDLNEASDEIDDDGKKHARQLPANVIAIKLNREEIVLNCQATDKSCSIDKIIEVETIAVDPEGEEQKYVYIVTAGKIIGKGADVRWDLSDVKSGKYTITVGIDMPGYGILGQTQTKLITVKDCPDCK